MNPTRVKLGDELSSGYNYDSVSVRLPFDCHSTAPRPIDDLRYDRRPTHVCVVCGVWCGVVVCVCAALRPKYMSP